MEAPRLSRPRSLTGCYPTGNSFRPLFGCLAALPLIRLLVSTIFFLISIRQRRPASGSYANRGFASGQSQLGLSGGVMLPPRDCQYDRSRFDIRGASRTAQGPKLAINSKSASKSEVRQAPGKNVIAASILTARCQEVLHRLRHPLEAGRKKRDKGMRSHEISTPVSTPACGYLHVGWSAQAGPIS